MLFDTKPNNTGIMVPQCVALVSMLALQKQNRHGMQHLSSVAPTIPSQPFYTDLVSAKLLPLLPA